ncbi:MAG TPA: Uma2 family endonuclease [Pyrinomonadaceae bacterium]|nr:Uma2 family endonuclease [Pyrinomonadaceae bacterium]
MSTETITYVTPDEYLTAERLSETRSEYLDGVVCPMTGGSLTHIQITSNLTAELSVQLRSRPCRVLAIDLKVRIPDSRKFFYPDVTVVCGEPQFHDERKDIILNPILVIEVLSPSIEAFDRGAKFQAYQTIESLKEYVLVAQDTPIIEQYVRQADGKWTYTSVAGLESSIALPSVECTLNLSAVYDKVDLDQ